MRDHWDAAPLGDLLVALIDHRGKTPKKLGYPDFSDAGVPVVSAIHIKGGRIVWQERERYVPYPLFERWMPEKLKKGDVLVTSEAPLGEVAEVPTDDPLVLSQRLFALRGKGDVLDNRYLRYFLQSESGQRALHDRATGSTVQGIRQSELVKVVVPLPPLAEQRAIAGVLGVLDDLIDTNLRTAEACGRQADASWKSAFFERDLALRVGDEAAVVLGGTPSRVRADYWGGGVPWLNSGKANEFRVIAPSEWITEAGLASSSTKMMPPGTTLIAITGATLGQITRSEIAACGNQSLVGVYADEQALNDFLFFAIRDQVDSMVASATGGAQQHINKGNVEELLVARPDPGVLAAWHRAAAPLLRAPADLLREAEALRRTRDELLPLLMSGAVSVGEVAA